MARTRSLIPWLLLAVTALIIYGSLYPFNFKADAVDGGLLQALSKLSWARAGRSDRIANVLLYLPLGFCAFLWVYPRFNKLAAVFLATLMGAALSLFVEVAQVYISARVPSLKDLALNTFGASLGAAGGLIWRGVARLMHLPTREEIPVRDPGAALLVGSWLVFRAAPFLPQWDLGKLKSALRPLFDPQWDAVAVFIYLVCWLVVNQALSSLVRRSQRLEALLLIIAAVLVARLVVANQSLVADELLALLLMLPLLVVMHRLTARVRTMILTIGIGAVLMIEALAPFDFATPASSFNFWPFMIWFDGSVASPIEAIDWTALLGRLFLFAALLWLLREAYVPITPAIAIVTGAALALEIAQLWLPDQGGSITDPALVLGLGVLLRSMDSSKRRRRLGRQAIPPVAHNR
jgi:VanZ family protein